MEIALYAFSQWMPAVNRAREDHQDGFLPSPAIIVHVQQNWTVKQPLLIYSLCKTA